MYFSSGAATSTLLQDHQAQESMFTMVIMVVVGRVVVFEACALFGGNDPKL